jgi:hypothetical protein
MAIVTSCTKNWVNGKSLWTIHRDRNKVGFMKQDGLQNRPSINC